MRHPIYTFYLAIFLIPLVVNPMSAHIYNVSKIIWFYMIISITLVAGGLMLFQKEKIQIHFKKNISLYLGGFILSIILSTLFSIAPIESFFGSYLKGIGGLFFIFLVIHFLISSQLFSDKKTVAVFFKMVKIIGLIMAVHAIGQLFNIDPFSSVDNKEYLFRVYSTIGQPNLFGQFLIFPLFISFFDILKGRKIRKKKQFISNILLFVLLAVVLFLTKNRATLLAVMLSFYLFFMFSDTFKRNLKGIVTVLLAVLGVGAIFLMNPSLRSFHSRGLLWKHSLEMVDGLSVWLGSGINTFYQTYPQVMPKETFEYEKFFTTPASPHNEALQMLLERGVLGLTLYAIPIILLIILLFKKRLKNITSKIAAFSILAYMISAFFSFSSIEHWVYLVAFWSILLISYKPFDVKTIHFNRLRYYFFFFIMMIIGGMSLFFSYQLFKSDLFIKKGFDSYIEKPVVAKLLFSRAVASTPYFTYPKEIVINLYSDGKSATKEYLESAGKITGYNHQYHILSFSLTEPEMLKKHINAAQILAPNLPLVYLEAGDVYFEKRDCKNALIYYDKLLDLAPSQYTKKDSQIFKEKEEFRIFAKHASGFMEAMEKREFCLGLIE